MGPQMIVSVLWAIRRAQYVLKLECDVRHLVAPELFDMKTPARIFVVIHRKAEWILRSDSLLYGPYATYGDAFIGAVSEAQAVGCSGTPSTVVVEDENRDLKVGWRYGIDPLPLRCR